MGARRWPPHRCAQPRARGGGTPRVRGSWANRAARGWGWACTCSGRLRREHSQRRPLRPHRPRPGSSVAAGKAGAGGGERTACSLFRERMQMEPRVGPGDAGSRAEGHGWRLSYDRCKEFPVRSPGTRSAARSFLGGCGGHSHQRRLVKGTVSASKGNKGTGRLLGVSLE